MYLLLSTYSCSAVGMCYCCGHSHGVAVCMNICLNYHGIRHDVACVTVIVVGLHVMVVSVIAVAMGACVIAFAAPVFTNNLIKEDCKLCIVNNVIV